MSGVSSPCPYLDLSWLALLLFRLQVVLDGAAFSWYSVLPIVSCRFTENLLNLLLSVSVREFL